MQRHRAEASPLAISSSTILSKNITSGQHQSALVPIVQSRVAAEKVTLWNADSVPLARPLDQDTSGQILDSGSFNIIEGNTFGGRRCFGSSSIPTSAGCFLCWRLRFARQDAGRLSTSPYTRCVSSKQYDTRPRRAQKHEVHAAQCRFQAAMRIIEQSFAGKRRMEAQPEHTQAGRNHRLVHRFRVGVDAAKTADQR